jgi:hypothetical protein
MLKSPLKVVIVIPVTETTMTITAITAMTETSITKTIVMTTLMTITMLKMIQHLDQVQVQVPPTLLELQMPSTLSISSSK